MCGVFNQIYPWRQARERLRAMRRSRCHERAGELITSFYYTGVAIGGKFVLVTQAAAPGPVAGAAQAPPAGLMHGPPGGSVSGVVPSEYPNISQDCRGDWTTPTSTPIRFWSSSKREARFGRQRRRIRTQPAPENNMITVMMRISPILLPPPAPSCGRISSSGKKAAVVFVVTVGVASTTTAASARNDVAASALESTGRTVVKALVPTAPVRSRVTEMMTLALRTLM